MPNTNDNVFRPEPAGSFFPGRVFTSTFWSNMARNHNFILARSGHIVASQAGQGESIATDGTARVWAQYVGLVHPRTARFTLRLDNVSGTAGYEFRLQAVTALGTYTSPADGGANPTVTVTLTGGEQPGDIVLLQPLVRRTSGSGPVTVGSLRITVPTTSTDPLTSATTWPALTDLVLTPVDTMSGNEPVPVQQLQNLQDLTESAISKVPRYICNVSRWVNYGLTTAPGEGFAEGTPGGAETLNERLFGGVYVDGTTRRDFRVFANGRTTSSNVTCTLAVPGYAPTDWQFTVATGNTPVTFGSWSAWDLPFGWQPGRGTRSWDLVGRGPASNSVYLQSLCIMEYPR